MVLLTFALLGISALAWSGAVKDAKASSADRRIRNAGYNLNRDFENVLRACHVKRKSKDGIKEEIGEKEKTIDNSIEENTNETKL